MFVFFHLLVGVNVVKLQPNGGKNCLKKRVTAARWVDETYMGETSTRIFFVAVSLR